MKKRTRFTQHILLYFLLSLLIGWAPSLSAQSDYRLAEQDSLALVAFYWATDGPNWNSNQAGFGVNDLSSEWQTTYDGQFNNWLDGPAKDWFGVKVEKRPIVNSTDSSYRVTWIWPVIGRRTDGQNQLDGYIPREVGLLTELNHFRINGNDGFTWELMPDEIYHPSLQHLDLESCWFDGDVSDALRNCTDIRKMNLRYNNFDYIPNWDFLDEPALRNLEGTQWLYNSRFSYAYLEKIIDHFYSVSPNLKEFQVEFRDMFDVGDEREIVAPLGSTVDIVSNDAGENTAFITYQWYKDGLSKFGRTQDTYSIPSVSAADYGNYTVRISNDYVKAYDQNTNYGEVFTKQIHLVDAPVPPVIEKAYSGYNGQYVDLYFSKPMSASALTGYQGLALTADGVSMSVLSVEVLGRLEKQVRIHLDAAIQQGDTIDLDWAAAGNILDQNGGLLQAFSGYPVVNRVRRAPVFVQAATSLDGGSIQLIADGYIDETSLTNASFLVQGDSVYSVASVTLAPGDIDRHISKTLILTLVESIVDTAEVITVQYESGKVFGLYGGTIAPGDTLPVENLVSIDRLPVRLTFEDGSEVLENIFVSASWKVNPLPMYDDGTNSDAVANDHIWTYSTLLAEDDYSWNVFARTEIAAFDTISTVDPVTGVVTLTLVPIVINQDSSLSDQILLEFSVTEDEVVGDTVYGIQNRDVTFNLRTQAATDDVFLMGIDGDWSVGRMMIEVNMGTLYSDTLFKLTAGDIIEYNYRIGNDWENLTPEPRRYVVKNGPNLIEDQFGIFTGIEGNPLSPISLYPNPNSDGMLYISGIPLFSQLDLYTLTGQVIQSIPEAMEPTSVLNISQQAKGLYLLKVTTPNHQVFIHKILFR